MLATARDAAGPLLGRDAETELLMSLLGGIGSSGGALVCFSRKAHSPPTSTAPRPDSQSAPEANVRLNAEGVGETATR